MGAVNQAINETATFIKKRFSESQLKSLYGKLEKVGGKTGKDSVFQKLADRIKNIKPYAFTNALLQIIQTLFKSPDIAKLAVKGYQGAGEFQALIDNKEIEPAEAGAKLKEILANDPIAKKIKAPTSLINFLTEGVVLALKILKAK